MKHDNFAVARELHVEFGAIGAECDCIGERRNVFSGFRPRRRDVRYSRDVMLSSTRVHCGSATF